ncbi:efflux RND transporter periplasmic adaptor subunit [Kaarinaea lacus]
MANFIYSLKSTVNIWRDMRVSSLMIVVLATITALSGCGKKEEVAPQREIVRPVKAMVLGAAESKLSRQFPGTVRASDRVDLSFNVPGRLVELSVKQGDSVKKGDLIARLDARDFESNLKAAEARYTETKTNYDRGKDLVKQGFISKIQFDQLRSNFEQAEADLAVKKKALNDTYLRAPFGGKVAKRFVQNFEDVNAKQTIISLQDTAMIEVVVNAPERIIAGARGPTDGSRATAVAVFDSVPGKEFELSIKEFATEADPKTQTFEYVLIMPQPKNANILPGMTATVIVTAKGVTEEEPSYVIPALAVFANEAGVAQVWIVDPNDNTVHSREVQTDELVGSENIRITKGLKSGDMIAVAGVSVLREGMQVRPVDKIEF